MFQDIALMDEQEREDFIKKIGISAGDSDETDDDDEEEDPEHHKYNCKKCQVSLPLTGTETSTHTSASLSEPTCSQWREWVWLKHISEYKMFCAYLRCSLKSSANALKVVHEWKLRLPIVFCRSRSCSNSQAPCFCVFSCLLQRAEST